MNSWRIPGSRAIAALLVVGLLASSSSAVEITRFFGGDADDGLDLDGNFPYAVNISGPGGQVIRDVEFTEDLDTEGFFIEASHNLLDWASPDYGDTDNDDALEEIMQSIRWSNVPDQNPETVNIEMDVTQGQSYKLQMLFTESCCDRGFDITLDEELLVDDFVIYEHHEDDVWNIPSREDGVLITHDFVATSNLVALSLGAESPDYPDNNGHISAITLEAVGGGADGDFDGSGELDAADIDLLSDAVRNMSMDAKFDVDGDGTVAQGDREVWVTSLRGTWFGDSDLNGEFNSADFVKVFTEGKYEDGIPANANWESGDWNGDGDFDSGDFVVAFSGGGFEVGPRQAVQSVPEPSCGALLVIGLLGLCASRRR